MIAQNHIKSKKFKFDEVDTVDFSWEINPEDLSTPIEPNYNRFLRNVYKFDPSKHNLE
jgi:hypothetical protein